MRRSLFLSWLAAALAIGSTVPAAAQVRTIDPNQAIDSDLTPPPAQSSQPPVQSANPYGVSPDQSAAPADDAQAYPDSDQDDSAPPPSNDQSYPADARQNGAAAPQSYGGQTPDARRDAATQADDTYDRDDLIAGAEGVFGKGAEGLAGIIEKILKDQGRPNAYIAGREASGAFVVGLRYGSGILNSKIEGQQPVYWTGPSVGFDVGGDANKVFVLVYNLYDTEELYKRFPAGEGHVYFVGGFSASYLRSGNTVLIPVRLGVGWRAGVNVGYMKFTHHEKWLPF